MEVVSPLLSVERRAHRHRARLALWGRPSDAPARLRARFAGVARTLEHKLYFDEAYDVVFYRPAYRLALFLDRAVETPLVLGSAGGIAGGVRALGRRVAAVQTGLLRAYAILDRAGAAVIVLVFILVR